MPIKKPLTNTSWFVIRRVKPFTGEYLAVGSLPVFGCKETAKRYVTRRQAEAVIAKLKAGRPAGAEQLEVEEIPLDTPWFGKDQHKNGQVIVGQHLKQRNNKRYYFWMSDYISGIKFPCDLKDLVGMTEIFVNVAQAQGRHSIVKVMDVIPAAEAPFKPTAIARTLFIPRAEKG